MAPTFSPLCLRCLCLYHILFLIAKSPQSAAAFAATAATAASASDVHNEAMPNAAPSVVYTVAGSDSGGGAGIQADLKAIHSLSGGTCHGCSAVTCLTAQNSCGVTAVHSPPASFLREQLDALEGDLPPRAVKVGMLGTRDLAEEVGGWLKTIKEGRDANGGGGRGALVVVDPVMISTSGHKLVDDAAKSAMIERVFPYADLVTPNKFEAEELLGRKLQTPEDVEAGAREILAMGPRAVLIKGGHSLLEEQGKEHKEQWDEDNVSAGYAQDYLLTSVETAAEGKPVEDKSRLCDGSRGVWLRSARFNTIHTHGTGCTLSSAIATSWAIGERERADNKEGKAGALSSMHLVDACCVAKAYVTAGIARGVQVRCIMCFPCFAIQYSNATHVIRFSCAMLLPWLNSLGRGRGLWFTPNFQTRTSIFQQLH